MRAEGSLSASLLLSLLDSLYDPFANLLESRRPFMNAMRLNITAGSLDLANGVLDKLGSMSVRMLNPFVIWREPLLSTELLLKSRVGEAAATVDSIGVVYAVDCKVDVGSEECEVELH